MKSRLSDVPAAIRMSRATLRNIHENLFWAFFYNIIGIPLAAGVWYPLFGWKFKSDVSVRQPLSFIKLLRSIERI